MSEVEDLQNEAAAGMRDDAEPNSIVARLRELRAEFQADVSVDLPVPGYRGELVARYAPLPWNIIRALAIRGDKGRRNPENAPMIAADALANACIGMYYRGVGGELEPVLHQGDPVRYDKGLAYVLNLEGETTREIVRAVFPDTTSLVAHYGALMEWQSEREDEDAEGDALRAAAESDDSIRPS
jgi:hypothetical protein